MKRRHQFVSSAGSSARLLFSRDLKLWFQVAGQNNILLGDLPSEIDISRDPDLNKVFYRLELFEIASE